MSTPYLSANQVSYAFGSQILFENLNINLHPGERLGIIGANGAGKSTLLRILAGELSADSGTIALRNDCKTAFIKQECTFSQSQTIREYLLENFPAEFDCLGQEKMISDQLEALSLEAEKNPLLFQEESWLQNYEQLHESLSKNQGVSKENIVDSLLSFGKISHLASKNVFETSGGEKKKIQILRYLLEFPHCLFLDEPTNHLDLETVDWLEEVLLEILEQGFRAFGHISRQEPIAMILVSHDRSILDTLCTSILEIENGKGLFFQGNFESFIEQKNTYIEENTEKQTRMKNIYRRELSWLRAGVKARGTKQQARILRAQKLHQNLGELKVTLTSKP